MIIRPTTDTFGAGSDLIYLPGNMQTTKDAAPIIKELTKKYKVTVIGLPGNIDSPLDSNYGFDYLADSLHGILSRLGRVHIAASSYGAATALRYAEKYPQQTRSLSLFGASKTLSLKAKTAVMSGLKQAKTDKTALAASYCQMFLSGKVSRHKVIKRACMKYFSSLSDAQLSAAYENSLRLFSLTEDRKYHIRAPTLCIAAEYDSFISPSSVLSLARAVGARFTMIRDADHMFPIARPKCFASTITGHIENSYHEGFVQKAA